MSTDAPSADRILRRMMRASALVLLAASCRDEDLTDEPIAPDNVGASMQECHVGDPAPFVIVEVTNGTGHAARFEVTVAFVEDDVDQGSVAATSDEIVPGGAAVVRVEGSPGTAADDCRIVDVEDLST